MSLYCVVANLDKKEFLNPGEMELSSDVRAWEDWWNNGRYKIADGSTVFHRAVDRLIEDRWHGNRVALVYEGGTPSWDAVVARQDGYRNILPEIVLDLVERDPEGEGAIDLIRILNEHVKKLEREHEEELDEATRPHGNPDTETVDNLSNELEGARRALASLRYWKRRRGLRAAAMTGPG